MRSQEVFTGFDSAPDEKTHRNHYCEVNEQDEVVEDAKVHGEFPKLNSAD
jgi:hypothetical protein